MVKTVFKWRIINSIYDKFFISYALKMVDESDEKDVTNKIHNYNQDQHAEICFECFRGQ